MKILALVTDGFGGHGGIAQYDRDFSKALASLDAIESVRILPRRGDQPRGSKSHPREGKSHPREGKSHPREGGDPSDLPTTLSQHAGVPNDPL